MAIVQSSDFVGQYKIPKDCFSELNQYIIKQEKILLVQLFGAELYDLFIADLTGATPQVPQTSPYVKVFDPFHVDDGSGIRFSEGIKQMLLQFIYFHFLRDMQFSNTASGTVRPVGQSSESLNYIGSNLIEVYNDGVDNFDSIMWYLQDNPTDFPKYNGEFANYISGI